MYRGTRRGDLTVHHDWITRWMLGCVLPGSTVEMFNSVDGVNDGFGVGCDVTGGGGIELSEEC